MSKINAYQRGNQIAEWLTDVRGGFTIVEFADISFKLRPHLERSYDSWLQGVQRNITRRVKDGTWARLPDGRYRTIKWGVTR